MIEFLIGVDGGGSGTRVRLARADGIELGEGASGPSGLMHGIANAWAAVADAAGKAFHAAGLDFPDKARIAIGLGLAGVHNRQWAADFVAANPGYARVALETDGHTTVLGAHGGQPGAIIALGTGSVGEIKLADGRHVEVGGWGFPAGDEASGAWMGLRAVNHLQQVLDGRMPADAFAADVAQACGANGIGNDDGGAARNAVQNWLAKATQTHYAQLARTVLQHGDTNDAARVILLEAGRDVEVMANALDASGTLPIALCGGLAAPLRPYMPVSMLPRIVTPQGDSAAGALQLIQQRLKE